MRRVHLVVVGGGVAGLAGARAAAREAGALEVTLLETSDRLGGKVRTELVDGFPLEWGPDSFLADKPRGRDLAEELGLGPDLVTTGPRASRVYLWVDGRLRPLPGGLVMGIPPGPGPLASAVRNRVLPARSAVRAGLEPFVRAGRDATVGATARRRLGRTAAERLVEPLVGGVHGVAADQVGLREALPWAREGGSLTRGARRRPEGSRPAFLALRGGMQRLADALARDLPGVRVRTGCAAVRVAPRGRGFTVEAGGGEVEADAVLLALPAPDAAVLLHGVAPRAAAELGGVRFSSSAVVALRYAPDALGRELDGSGYLAVREADSVVAACSWLPSKWPHLARPDAVWLRAVVTDGGALRLDDDVLRHRAAAEVSRAMAARRPAERVLLRRWERALPVYAPGHRERIALALAALPPGIAFAGASVDGVGVPDCVRTGEDAARALVRSLSES